MKKSGRGRNNAVRFDETKITKAILNTYNEKLTDRVESDVLIAGAGPSGLTAAYYLAKGGYKVTILEKRLSPGGGTWGGGLGLNELVAQEEALPILDTMGIRHRHYEGGLHTADSVEFAAALSVKALQAGAVILNLMTVEDVCLEKKKLIGLVANRTMISGALHVDPLVFHARAVLDGTGHDAVLAQHLRKREILPRRKASRLLVEGPMNATEGEAFVIKNSGQIYPGLWVSGMSVCAAYGGPRMGPIFGGMLLSGRKVAELIALFLSKNQR